METITAAAKAKGMTRTAYIRQRSLGKHSPETISPQNATLYERVAAISRLLTRTQNSLTSLSTEQDIDSKKPQLQENLSEVLDIAHQIQKDLYSTTKP